MKCQNRQFMTFNSFNTKISRITVTIFFETAFRNVFLEVIALSVSQNLKFTQNATSRVSHLTTHFLLLFSADSKSNLKFTQNATSRLFRSDRSFLVIVFQLTLGSRDSEYNNRVLRLPAMVFFFFEHDVSTRKLGPSSGRNVVFKKTIAGRRRTLLLNVKPARMSVKSQ